MTVARLVEANSLNGKGWRNNIDKETDLGTVILLSWIGIDILLIIWFISCMIASQSEKLVNGYNYYTKGQAMRLVCVLMAMMDLFWPLTHTICDKYFQLVGWVMFYTFDMVSAILCGIILSRSSIQIQELTHTKFDYIRQHSTVHNIDSPHHRLRRHNHSFNRANSTDIDDKCTVTGVLKMKTESFRKLCLIWVLVSVLCSVAELMASHLNSCNMECKMVWQLVSLLFVLITLLFSLIIATQGTSVISLLNQMRSLRKLQMKLQVNQGGGTGTGETGRGSNAAYYSSQLSRHHSSVLTTITNTSSSNNSISNNREMNKLNPSELFLMSKERELITVRMNEMIQKLKIFKRVTFGLMLYLWCVSLTYAILLYFGTREMGQSWTLVWFRGGFSHALLFGVCMHYCKPSDHGSNGNSSNLSDSYHYSSSVAAPFRRNNINNNSGGKIRRGMRMKHKVLHQSGLSSVSSCSNHRQSNQMNSSDSAGYVQLPRATLE